jgi:hypothetical protein
VEPLPERPGEAFDGRQAGALFHEERAAPLLQQVAQVRPGRVRSPEAGGPEGAVLHLNHKIKNVRKIHDFLLWQFLLLLNYPSSQLACHAASIET